MRSQLRDRTHVQPHQDAPKSQGAGQGAQLSRCTRDSGFGVQAQGHPCALSCWGHQQAWLVPAELQARSTPAVGAGGEPLSLPGTLIKALRSHPPPSPLTTHKLHPICVLFTVPLLIKSALARRRGGAELTLMGTGTRWGQGWGCHCGAGSSSLDQGGQEPSLDTASCPMSNSSSFCMWAECRGCVCARDSIGAAFVHMAGGRAVFTCKDGIGAAWMSRDGYGCCVHMQGWYRRCICLQGWYRSYICSQG